VSIYTYVNICYSRLIQAYYAKWIQYNNFIPSADYPLTQSQCCSDRWNRFGTLHEHLLQTVQSSYRVVGLYCSLPRTGHHDLRLSYWPHCAAAYKQSQCYGLPAARDEQQVRWVLPDVRSVRRWLSPWARQLFGTSLGNQSPLHFLKGLSMDIMKIPGRPVRWVALSEINSFRHYVESRIFSKIMGENWISPCIVDSE